MKLGGGVHLTYCSNIHPGESWPEVRANLGRHVLAVRDRLRPAADFGVGLRLSARAAAELSEPAALTELKAFLARERLYVFTLNGFPYGTFHGARVKEAVYLPDWRDPERLRYTNQLADLMAALLPDEPGLEGSVSTAPGAYKAALGGPDDLPRMVDHLLQHVAHLVALQARTGRAVTLALEPEPDCFLETIDEVVGFFQAHLFCDAAVHTLASRTGLEAAAAAAALRRHLGICLDLCHAAVEYEDAAPALQRLREAGIRVPKMQISAGLRLPALDAEAVQALRRFVDPVYLHQVIERGPDGLRRFADLPQALATLAAASPGAREWRVHFHVPIFMDRLAPFGSTQAFIREVLALHRAQPVSAHLEVETYTWDVLPEPFRSGAVDEAVARELAWVMAELQA
ncbi:xylose isomerase-like enzyme [Burkholderiales bacterium JOSHI_001]|nr:xylose isomerase-like enzyme [Burkholderiales bacterium JOSHI_001]